MKLRRNEEDHSYSWGSGFANRHPVIANILIISVIALLGLYAAYLSAALFTKHGRTLTVPGVENLTYTEAVEKLHAAGLKVDIRDSIYRDDLRPGIVIEQFPKARSVVKPGRKIFLYINSVHPKEVILDDDNHPSEYALKGESYRSALAKLEELGFKNIKMVKVLGVSDRVVKIIANGRPVRKMQKVPVNVSIVVEVSDGRLNDLQDSLQNAELLRQYEDNPASFAGEPAEGYGESYGNYELPEEKPKEQVEKVPLNNEEENSQYF